MYRSILLPAALFSALANAQPYVHQVVLLNEGYYDYTLQQQVVPPSLGSYDPATQVYTPKVIIDQARFGSDIDINDGHIYVSADTRVLKYDADTYALLDEVEVLGVRSLAFWGDRLVLVRAEFQELTHFAEVRDKHTLDLLYTVGTAEGLPYTCEDVEVLGDRAYLAVNNGFDVANVVGYLGVLDLTTGTIEDLEYLGPNGTNPENVMLRDGVVYTLNNKDYTGSSISKYSNSLDYTEDVAELSGCATSEISSVDAIYFMEYASGGLARFNLISGVAEPALQGSPEAYGLLDDPINNVLYATVTDYVTQSTLHVIDHNGQTLSTVEVGLSPGSMALDVRTVSGVVESSAAKSIAVPNPTTGSVLLDLVGEPTDATAEVRDALGRLALVAKVGAERTTLDLSALPAGAYTIQSITTKGVEQVRVAKQ
jgi:hypothetical protein